jgi:Co/Zn/Cd efflux system component
MTCCDHDCSAPQTNERYRRVLWAALAVNVAMFLVEIVASIVAGSVSLRADALDFLADAANYAVALAVVGLALLKGSVMELFGLWVAVSTVYHAITATIPRAELIGAIGLLALVANLAVVGLLYRYRAADSQTMAVWLCTRNDCIANIAVIVAGAGVWASGTPWPDIARGRDHRLSRAVVGHEGNPASTLRVAHATGLVQCICRAISTFLDLSSMPHVARNADKAA